MLPCLFHRVFRRQLRREGGAFPGPLETLHSGRGPRDDIPAEIGNGYNGVVESGLDMSDPLGDILFFLFLPCFPDWLCHGSSGYRLYFFLPAIDLLGPFRVRALVLVL